MLDCEFIPARESSSKALMIVLHGLGDSTAGYQWLPSVLELPWMNYLLVNAPDPYYGGFSWFDFAGDFRPGVERSRKSLVALLGGEATSSVTRKTTYLVAGVDPGSKLQKAQGYGTTILDEDAFLKLLGEHGLDAP